MTQPSAGAGSEPGFRCSTAARVRGDEAVGTAAPTRRWLLVEHPGPWGRDALLQSRLDPVVAAGLTAQAARAGVRVLLVRRPGRTKDTGTRRWGIADSRVGRESLHWGEYDDPRQLLDLPLEQSAAPRGEPSSRPAYLVCTHGRHDLCCAVRGRPVAAALAAERPEETWECSHLGGDRFATNVVVLPHGLVYGQVEPGDAPDVARSYERGLVHPSRLRGRAGLTPAEQAAQHAARARLGLHGVDDLPPVRTEVLGEHHYRVVLRRHDGDGVVAVDLRVSAREVPTPLTCAAHAPTGVVRSWATLAVEQRPG